MATRRWVRYVMPVMVEVDCDSDEVTRVVTLPEEIQEDRGDDTGHFWLSRRTFRPESAPPSVRTRHGCQAATVAFCVGEPRWQPTLRAGGPVTWPARTRGTRASI